MKAQEIAQEIIQKTAGLLTDEQNKQVFSQRKVWSLVALAAFVAYNANIIIRHNPSDIPKIAGGLIGIIITFYFSKKFIPKLYNGVKEKIEKRKLEIKN